MKYSLTYPRYKLTLRGFYFSLLFLAPINFSSLIF